MGSQAGAVVAVRGDQRRQPATAHDRVVEHIGAGPEQGIELGQRIIPEPRLEQVFSLLLSDHADARRADPLGQGEKLACLGVDVPVQVPQRGQPVGQQQHA